MQKKPFVNIDLDQEITAEQLVDILLYSSGLPDPIYHPVSLFFHFTQNNSFLNSEVLRLLGLDKFKGDKFDLLEKLYMLSNSIEKLEKCNLDEIELKRYEKIKSYEPIEIITLTEFYSNTYDSINRIRKFNNVSPYCVIIKGGLLFGEKLEEYIIDWIYDPDKIINELDMLPSKVIPEIDYSWDAFRTYDGVINMGGNVVDEMTDKQLVKFLEKNHPDVQIKYKTRLELIDLVNLSIN